MQLPKILFVCNMPAFYQVELFEALSQRPECDLHVFFLRTMTPGRQWTRLLENNYPHTFIRELRVHPHFYLNRGLFRALRAVKPDLIVISQYASIGMQLLMYHASFTNIPWVFWSERPGVEYTETPIFESDTLRRFFRKISLLPLKRWPQEIWAVGQKATDYYESAYHIPCWNLPFYSDLTRFLSIPRQMCPDIVHFLYSGKLNFRKGVDLLIEAVRLLAKETCRFSISFMGDGPLKDDVLLLVEELPDNVSYLGFKEIDEIPSVLAVHDAQLCCSRYDGWGMVIPEAMAAGLTTVGTYAVGAAIDMIEDGKNGLIVDANSTQALYFAMKRIVDTPHWAYSMALAGRQTAQDYGAEQGAAFIAERIVSVLK